MGKGRPVADETKSPLHVFRGSDLTVTWDERLCIHVGECVRAEEGVFGGDKKPWGRPDEALPNEVAEIVRRCPSGALTFERGDDGAEETAPGDNTVVVSNNGPLYLTGDLQIDGATEDMPGVRFRAALCRCGLSSNKPFCDNSHEAGSFRDRGAIGATGPGTEDDGGPLEVTRAKNGPLLVSGSFTLVAASGRTAWRGTKAALCRCGASKNKPFCDGSHKTVGFEAE